MEARAIEEDDFDWDAELEHFHQSGYQMPSPALVRAERIHDLVESVGWNGAIALCTWRVVGWEVDFLGRALPLL